jgi:hypothetical protein
MFGVVVGFVKWKNFHFSKYCDVNLYMYFNMVLCMEYDEKM